MAALLAPGAFGLIVAVHLSAHHTSEPHDDSHRAPADFSVVWHGHSHAAKTPQHGHPALFAPTQALRIATGAQLSVETPAQWPYPAFAAAVAQRFSRLRPPDLAGVGPPPRREQLSILRI